MLDKIKFFWNAFWDSIKSAYNKAFKGTPKGSEQKYKDIEKINFLAIFVSKLTNLANAESTFTVASDSALADPIKKLCADLESKRFDVSAAFLGEGDSWVFPAHKSDGTLYHRYIPGEQVRILATDGDEITDVVGIIDIYVDDKNKTFFLNRRHTLSGENLKIETYITNDKNERTSLAAWDELVGEWSFENAHHIGVGRFKSPASSRGMSPVYGVPLNFGCADIEKKIFNDLEMVETEFSRAESKLFVDPLFLKKSKNANGEDEWKMPEGMFAVNQRGDNKANIDIFSPAIRYPEYHGKLLDDLLNYEQQVGTDRGFLTPFESEKATTATEIRRANASTIALVGKIQQAIADGVRMTLEADSVFLNIPLDLWTLSFDWYDVFEDADKQYERIANAVDRGIAEKSDELKWLFPNLSEDEITEKIDRIKAEKSIDIENRLNDLIGGA